ncbi:MAG: hypothetical protein U0519_01455 [Candidatus Gracilibacteria bacterium]
MDRILVAIFGIPLGFLMMIYRYQLKQFTGPIQWAEQYLGSGGTYNLFILVGLGISIVSLMYALGTIQDLFSSGLGPIFGVGQQ